MRTAILLAMMLTGSSPTVAQEAVPPQPAAAEQPDVAAADAAFQKQDWQAAVTAYRAALAKGVAPRILHFRLGYALHMLKQYEEALKHHLLAIPISNRAIRIDALYNCACAHALLGRKDEALRFLQFAIDAGFQDTTQVAKDTDLDSLRDLAAFKDLINGIGKAPRLDQHLDFAIGSWRSQDAGITRTLTITRPQAATPALLTTLTISTSGNPREITGFLTPNAADRTWSWVTVGDLGARSSLTGSRVDGAVVFEGRESTIGGDGLRLRVTLSRQNDALVERAEVSDDGAAWRTRHEVRYTPAADNRPLDP